jgi:hypothetical protein
MKKKISKVGPIATLLSDETKWCKNFLGKTATGKGVCGSDSRAVQWCLLGAVEKIYGNFSPESIRVRGKLRRAICKLFPKYAHSIADFNNSNSFRSVRRVLKLARV